MPFKADEFKDDPEFKTFLETTIGTVLEPEKKAKEGLLNDLAKLKEKLREVDGLDLAALKLDSEKLKQLLIDKSGKETETEKALRLGREQHEKTVKELSEKVEGLLTRNKTLLIDDALKSCLVKTEVKAELLDAAMMVLKPSISLLEENGQMVARVGDKTIAEFVAEWAKTPVGKNFIMAKSNSGGGGSGSGDITIDEAKKFFVKGTKDYNLTEQAKIRRSNPELYNKIVKSL